MTEAIKNPTDILWCCHVRGPDDVHAAPDYATALAWADGCLDLDRAIDHHADPLLPYLSAIAAPWPYSAESHATDLPKSIEYFTPPVQASA